MRSLYIVLAITLVLLFSSVKPHNASRILQDEQQEEEEWTSNLLFQSLQRGPVRPPSPNGCTYIPRQGGAPCTSTNTINQMNFVGHAMPPPTADPYPHAMHVEFGVASGGK